MSILTHSHYIEGNAKTMAMPLRLVLWRTRSTVSGKACPARLYQAHHHRRTIANTLELPTGIRVTIPGWRVAMPEFLCQGGCRTAPEDV
jgi:hypothetical protein